MTGIDLDGCSQDVLPLATHQVVLTKFVVALISLVLCHAMPLSGCWSL